MSPNAIARSAVNARMRVAVCLLAGSVGILLGGEPVRKGPPAAEASAVFDPGHIRAVQLYEKEEESDPTVLFAVRRLGANTVVTHSSPDQATARAVAAARLFYIAWMSTEDVARAATDADYADRLRAVQSLSGVYFEDDSAPEGYASPQTQESAYEALRSLFPGVLVLHPTRLDPIASDPTYLDLYFRPQFTDLVTPYFYPVGTTVIGTFTENDPWEALLESLLRAMARRMPPGKGVLPVLQGFEQVGFPLHRRFPERQSEVYARVWPANENAAVFAWGSPMPPLIGLGYRPNLRRGVCDLFAGLSSTPLLCRSTPIVRRHDQP